MFKFVAATPSIRHLVAFSANGDGLVNSLQPMPIVNVADRGYFAYHKSHADPRPLVGLPIQNRADGSWSFTLVAADRERGWFVRRRDGGRDRLRSLQ